MVIDQALVKQVKDNCGKYGITLSDAEASNYLQQVIMSAFSETELAHAPVPIQEARRVWTAKQAAVAASTTP